MIDSNYSYIVEAKRTAIGAFLGSVSTTSAPKLLSKVIAHIIEKCNLPYTKVSQLIVGNVLQAGLGQGPARQAALYAKLPKSVIAYTVNMVCGSGMKALQLAHQEVLLGNSDCIFAGGMENMSLAPHFIPSARKGTKYGNATLYDHVLHDGLTDAFHEYPMGNTAEHLAKKYAITRKTQDRYAFQSQQRALEAISSGAFKEEIVPIEVQSRRNTIIFDTDEFPNANSTLEKLAALRPAFIPKGTVTAGNSSGINDGASAILLASKQLAQKHNLTVKAKIHAFTEAGINPKEMGMGPFHVIKSLLKKTGLSYKDIGLFEINEAFAAQALAVLKELSKALGISMASLEKVCNIHGGGIALGHPIGCSGNRIVVTLLHAMIRKQVRYGIATLCIGGGMGIGVLIELV